MAKLTSQQTSEIAKRAAITNRARKAFLNQNPIAYTVARCTSEGYTAVEIAEILSISVASVRTYRANLTRGVYDDLLAFCNFNC